MIMTSVLFIAVGFVLLIYGANYLVNGSSALAKKFNISDIVIGLTVVAFGTSAPEMVVNVIASLEGQDDLVLSNVIGSNNFNLFIILGLAGMIYPITVHSNTAWREIPISIFVIVLFYFLANNFLFGGDPNLSLIEGVILLILFTMFLAYIFKQIQSEPQQEEIIEKNISNTKLTFMIIGGLFGLVLGGKLAVDHSVKVAEVLGVSEKLIGLTILAAGTSLPELATSVIAATKKNSDIAIGNVIGSNIFNILLIMGVSVVVSPIEYNTDLNQDLIILIFGSTALMIAMLTGKRKKLDRWEAAILFVFYLSYMVWRVISEHA